MCVAGTGIYNTQGTVIRGTQSVGVSLLFWLLGAINACAVTFLYIEFGLTIPRYDINNAGKVSVPRNGGELNYVQANSHVYHHVLLTVDS